MFIESVLDMDSGSVVCVENSATIKIVKSGDSKTFQPSFPEGTPPLSAGYFAELYKHKHFEPSKPVKSGAKD